MRSDARPGPDRPARRSWLAVVSAMSLVALGAAELAAPRAASCAKIAVIRSSRVGPFDQAVTAMTERLAASPSQPEILTFDLDGDSSGASALLQRVRESVPTLVVTVGSLATSAALDATPPLEMPIVFSMVLYPDLLAHRAKHPQLTGVCLDVPLDVQFDHLHRLLPAVRRIGVLYSPAETASIVRAAGEIAPKFGFELVSQRVDDPSEVPAALGSLMERIDALWTVADSRVFTTQTTPTVLLTALRHRKPVMGLSPGQVRSGALSALVVDYEEVGRATADMALGIAQGARADDIPIAHPKRVDLVLNRRTADLLEIRLPVEMEEAAREVVR